MPSIRKNRPWRLPESAATPEAVHLGRRRFLKAAGLGALGTLIGGAGCGDPGGGPTRAGAGLSPFPRAWTGRYPAPRNEAYTLDRPLTGEAVAGRYNNFYEFTTVKERVAELASRFPFHPWTVDVSGRVRRPAVFDIDRLVVSMPLEERLYRHRCVEAWAMAVPWTGFPFKALLDLVEPLGSARYVRLVSFHRPELAPGQARQPWYPWPYYEALTLAEASHELTLLATGVYGHPLPMQHGAPIRLVVPWKYGFKSIKSIVRIELTERKPATFWNDVAPLEYGFEADVDPSVPHPRWSQARERLIGTDLVVPTLPYNGYAELLAGLTS
ncbi:MAG TPA: protein-methionine-sulfoxide reductase catalytic subunit MsrP [Candidatus Polarisedimenticolia bacterium]|nr:protein-methionine-sulfoxide reductase catalytic subunit MsrP [Candidatus Polarisedimenticolia bacterium]